MIAQNDHSIFSTHGLYAIARNGITFTKNPAFRQGQLSFGKILKIVETMDYQRIVFKHKC